LYSDIFNFYKMSGFETKQVEVVVQSSEICSECDSSSLIPHAIQVTRLRVANMCCAGEEKIILATLKNVKGIENVAVNVIGRYAIVKHCATPCCAPADKIMVMLNAKSLGVTIQEVADREAEENEQIDLKHVLHVAVVSLLFCVGLILHFFPPLERASMGVYLASVALGVAPILHASYVTVVLRHTLDINVLMIIAIAGAVAAEEYFDASLVVSLFIGAELIEAFVMLRVRQAVRASSTSTVAKEAFMANGDKKLVADLKVKLLIAFTSFHSVNFFPGPSGGRRFGRAGGGDGPWRRSGG
jgi:Cd2+/Zn2+-exporting ATPase